MDNFLKNSEIKASWYRESDAFSAFVNYRILRAGHIKTAANFHIQRRSVVGHELIFCLNGGGFVKLENRLYKVKKGNLAWLPVSGLHEHYPDPKDSWEILWVRIDGAKLNNIMHFLNVLQQPVFELIESDKVEDIYYRILSLIQSRTLVADAHCDVLCAQLMHTLLANRSLDTEISPVVAHHGLGRLIYQINSHYSDEWDVEKFTQYCQVSKSQLFRLFQDTFNQSPMKWLKNYRLAQARRLLVETEESIGRIASLVGYKDPLHFSRDFHCSVGLSPSDFRRQEQFDNPSV